VAKRGNILNVKRKGKLADFI